MGTNVTTGRQPGADAPAPAKQPLVKKLFWWVLALPILLVIALVTHTVYLLDFTHVLAGSLWTGADIFMGFFVGPVMRRLAPDQRRAVINWLTPRTLLYLPVLGATTGTAGWYLSTWMHLLSPGNPSRPWVFGALCVITILVITGFGFLLPNSIRTYMELQKERPDFEKMFRLNRRNNMMAGMQGVMQVLIIIIMARLATM